MNTRNDHKLIDSDFFYNELVKVIPPKARGTIRGYLILLEMKLTNLGVDKTEREAIIKSLLELFYDVNQITSDVIIKNYLSMKTEQHLKKMRRLQK